MHNLDSPKRGKRRALRQRLIFVIATRGAGKGRWGGGDGRCCTLSFCLAAVRRRLVGCIVTWRGVSNRRRSGRSSRSGSGRCFAAHLPTLQGVQPRIVSRVALFPSLRLCSRLLYLDELGRRV